MSYLQRNTGLASDGLSTEVVGRLPRDSTIQWIAVLGFVVIGTLFVTELRRWRALGGVVGRRQKGIRVCLIVLMEILFAVTFVGPWVAARRDPVAALVYWSVCVLLAVAVTVLAVLDLRYVMRSYNSLTKEMFGELRGEDRRDR